MTLMRYRSAAMLNIPVRLRPNKRKGQDKADQGEAKQTYSSAIENTRSDLPDGIFDAAKTHADVLRDGRPG